MAEHYASAKQAVLERLSQEGLKLFEFVTTHEHRQDWQMLQRGAGKPSPKLRIVEKVREFIKEE